MAEEILRALERAGGAIGVVAVLWIAAGFVLATGWYVADYRKLGPQRSFSNYKVGLGRTLLLALEILVVADVIETITVKPTFGSLAALGVLVSIRTVVSWTLHLEVEGRWPWQPAEQE